ncbi:hypothetical protein [Burkholderia gladioli]|nr:hypothetical protein [Burkholderia gladioli]
MACAGESPRKIDHAGRARASGEHDNEAALAWRLLGVLHVI